MPHTVPVEIDVRVDARTQTAIAALAFFRDLLFELGAERARHEHVPGAGIVERVDDELKVVFVQQLPRVAPHLGRDDSVRDRVIRLDADIERLRVIHEAHHRAFGGGVPLRRLLLHELVDDCGALPRGFVRAPRRVAVQRAYGSVPRCEAQSGRAAERRDRPTPTRQCSIRTAGSPAPAEWTPWRPPRHRQTHSAARWRPLKFRRCFIRAPVLLRCHLVSAPSMVGRLSESGQEGSHAS